MDAAMVKSGTATLEAGLMGVPMVVVYRTNPITYLLASMLADVRHVGLVNIVAGRRLVPELVQDDCTAAKIAAAIREYLGDEDRRTSVRSEMLALRDQLGRPGCFERAAESALEMLAPTPGEEGGVTA
jgi:lipid-A-disaccharide synthase